MRDGWRLDFNLAPVQKIASGKPPARSSGAKFYVKYAGMPKVSVLFLHK